jgi:Ca2+/H+ antiporter, TMEM165/GDT1 family
MSYMDHSGRRNKKGLFVFLMCALVFAAGAAVMLLWNALIPNIFGVNSITYWQALGLLILARLLTGGFHFGKRHGGGGPPFARPGFREKWTNMSDEERQKMKAMWRERCGKRDTNSNEK